ncbi:hypothetical protein CcCBS67573_g06995 [Chytriomyces confervae]|uniref:Glycosyl transferase family 1 domain-containing protein n=1 Tax=Chytriomyces confervae TaxID=246404 RepID=A0A507F0Q7_9FUNG|nr:hypothetical protein CcCBS67573_g06995 [Chytriomyces confervae]
MAQRLDYRRKVLATLLFLPLLLLVATTYTYPLLAPKILPTPSSTPTHPAKAHTSYNEFSLTLPSGDATVFTINELLNLCLNGNSLTITKHYALYGNAQEYQYLSNCNPVEISTSQAARSRGHCSDFVQYIYYADARLVPQYSTETYHQKIQECPHSFYLHGEYPIHELFLGTVDVVDGHIRSLLDLTQAPQAPPPQRVRNIWMPNWEQIRKEEGWIIRASYMIACKAHITCTAIQKYLSDAITQQRHQTSEIENERRFANSTPILQFMSHSSPDARSPDHASEQQQQQQQQLDRFNQFYHAYGHSGRKSSGAIVDCWLRQPDWPKLVVIGHDAFKAFALPVIKNGARNIQLFERVSTDKLDHLQSTHGVHLCPSRQEGYGHYINEARSHGAVVVTTHHPPMQEFVEDGVSGILVNHKGPAPEDYQLMGDYETVGVNVEWENVCNAVKRVLEMTLEARAEMGRLARLRYEEDSEIMAKNLMHLKKEAEESTDTAFDGFDFLKLLDSKFAATHRA